MSPRVLEANRDQASRREAVLQAALELFAERGFHGTAVPLVAEKARVGTGTVYRYFDSKEALVNAVYQKWKTELATSISAELPTDLSPRKQFHEMWRRFAKFATKHPQALAFLELHHHQPYLDEVSRTIEDATLQPVVAFVAEAQRQEIIKPMEPMMLIALVLGALHGLLKAAWAGQLELTERVMDDAESCLWEAVRL